MQLYYTLDEIQLFGPNEEFVTVVYNSNQPKTVKSFGLIAGEGGVIVVSCIAVDIDGNATTGGKRVRFRKDRSGVLTLGTVQNDLATQSDNPMQGCSFSLVKNASTQDLEIQVTGLANKDIRWQIKFERNSCVLG